MSVVFLYEEVLKKQNKGNGIQDLCFPCIIRVNLLSEIITKVKIPYPGKPLPRSLPKDE